MSTVMWLIWVRVPLGPFGVIALRVFKCVELVGDFEDGAQALFESSVKYHSLLPMARGLEEQLHVAAGSRFES